jgi:hypothetical protein
MPAKRDIVERFWEKVAKGEGCWNWTGYRKDKGYGTIHNSDGETKRPVLAHRLSWEIANGPIPDGICVLHRCDNPACVRLDHLFLGTKADNNADMKAKGRASGNPACGEDAVWAKMTEAQVREMRDKYGSMHRPPVSKISADYRIHKMTVWNILTRRTWRHI